MSNRKRKKNGEGKKKTEQTELADCQERERQGIGFFTSYKYYRHYHTTMANSKDVLKLYRQMLKQAYKFDNYNFREYSKRRIHDAFKEHKSMTKQEEVDRFYNEGINNLALLHRQATISQMYTFDKLVVEPLKKHH